MKLMVCLILLLATVSGQADPCDGPIIEIGDKHRSTKHTLIAGDQAVCDSHTIKEGVWYSLRSESGVTIPERAEGSFIEVNQCGTTYPIWINGSGAHPSVAGVERTLSTCTNKGKGCDVSETITVRSCLDGDNNLFYIYLLNTPGICNVAYCAGEYTICQHGHVWVPTGIGEDEGACDMRYPSMQAEPVLRGPVIPKDADDDSFSFFCDISYTNTSLSPTARFLVTFLFDGKDALPDRELLDLDRVETDTSILSIELKSKFLQGRLGTNLSCSVKSFWNDDPSDLSETLYSNSYFIGIRFESKDGLPLLLQGSKLSSKLLLVPTIPVQCHKRQFMTQGCEYPISVFTEEGRVGTNDCSYGIFPNGTETYGRDIIQVSSVTELQSSEVYINFEPIQLLSYTVDGQSRYPVWHGYRPSPIQITLNRQSSSYCLIFRDTYTRTFDKRGSKCAANGYFYYAKSNSSRIFEVQGSHWNADPMDPDRYFTCGVAVREGNHILGLTMCRSPLLNGRFAIQQIDNVLGDRSHTGTITYNGEYYLIIMPSGARIYVYDRLYYLDMYMYMYEPYPIRDITRGLCYAEGALPWLGCPDYRVPLEENLFATPQKCMNYTISTPSCECHSGGPGGTKELTCDANSAVSNSQCFCI